MQRKILWVRISVVLLIASAICFTEIGDLLGSIASALVAEIVLRLSEKEDVTNGK